MNGFSYVKQYSPMPQKKMIEKLKYTAIRDDVRKMVSYTVTDATGLIKLDAMENPFQMPMELQSQLAIALAGAALNRYPSPQPKALLNKIRKVMAVPDELDIILGNGSDEIIAMLCQATASSQSYIMAPAPTFTMYSVYAQLAQQRFIEIPLNHHFEFDLQAMLNQIQQSKPALIFLSYPNNPTGNLFNDLEIEQIILAAPHSIVVIDEAYQPFAKQSWLDKAPKFNNVIVVRTFSKLGLAGIRLGWAAGAPHLLKQIDKVRPPYNVNSLTQICAAFALDHFDIFLKQAEKICEARDQLRRAITMGLKLTVYPSAANFLLVKTPYADNVFNDLFQVGILVKNVSRMHEKLQNCLRITIGTDEENVKLYEALAKSIDVNIYSAGSLHAF